MSAGDGIELTYLEEPPTAWMRLKSNHKDFQGMIGIKELPCTDSKGSALNSQNSQDLIRSFKDHLPYFAGENACVKEVNMNCCPDYERNRSKYVVDIKWLEDDEEAVKRWQRLTSCSSLYNSTLQLESHTSEMTLETSEPTIDDWLGSKFSDYDDTTSLSHGDADYETVTSVCEETITVDQSLDKDRNAAYTPAIPSLGNQNNSIASNNELPDHHLLAPTEMLSIRIIIIEKVRSNIVRREIDYEAPSDECVSSIYDILERNMSSLEKIQIYYSSRRIQRRTDLTKLPAGDRRPFNQLAGSQGSVIFVVAAPSVRIF